jgi:hypothetical protein
VALEFRQVPALARGCPHRLLSKLLGGVGGGVAGGGSRVGAALLFALHCGIRFVIF